MSGQGDAAHGPGANACCACDAEFAACVANNIDHLDTGLIDMAPEELASRSGGAAAAEDARWASCPRTYECAVCLSCLEDHPSLFCLQNRCPSECRACDARLASSGPAGMAGARDVRSSDEGADGGNPPRSGPGYQNDNSEKNGLYYMQWLRGQLNMPPLAPIEEEIDRYEESVIAAVFDADDEEAVAAAAADAAADGRVPASPADADSPAPEADVDEAAADRIIAFARSDEPSLPQRDSQFAPEARPAMPSVGDGEAAAPHRHHHHHRHRHRRHGRRHGADGVDVIDLENASIIITDTVEQLEGRRPRWYFSSWPTTLVATFAGIALAILLCILLGIAYFFHTRRRRRHVSSTIRKPGHKESTPRGSWGERRSVFLFADEDE